MTNTKTLLLLLCVALLLPPFVKVSAGLLLGNNERENRADAVKSGKVEGKWLLTYYVGYQNGYLKPKDVDYTLMTHIVVGGVGVTSDGTLREHWHLENGDGHEMALEVGRRADREGVKKLIWLGGPNEEDKFFSATSDSYREDFVDNIVTLIEELEYDGVDIDWEPVRKKDEPHLLALVKDLRKAKSDLIITVPVNWVPSSILFSKDLSIYRDLAKYVDRMFIMSYSMAGPWTYWRSWHGSALAGDTIQTPSSIQTSVFAYTKAGVPKDQLGVGIGTYATCWEFPIYKPRQVIPATFYPSSMHVMSMRTLMDEYYERKYEKWNNLAKMPYQSYRKARGDFDCGFISYENERSIEEKVEYVNRQDLAGVMVWNIGTGYFPEERSSRRHALLKEAWETLER